FTRETFIDGESSGIEPNDPFGRQMGLPPNSTANASFLLQLRNLLVQDWDVDDDGRADTLRLAFATPRRWLEDGKTIRIEKAPTQFGDVSFTIRSMINQGHIEADLALPQNVPHDMRLRFRLPVGYRITDARANGQAVAVDAETLDLSTLTDRTL